MFKNYFKTAWRNLLKNKFYSLINITGLTAGLAVGLLILLWVQDELSFDSFHKKTAEIYRLENMVGTGASTHIWQATAAPIGVLGKKEIPLIKDVARIAYNGDYSLFKYKDKVFNEGNNGYVDPSFFSMFDFNLVKGNAANPFPDNNSVVLTETAANRYFGAEEAVGKVISADDKVNFTVTGVIKDFPKNSSISGDMFFPMALKAKTMYEGRPAGETMDNDFHQYNYATYIQMQSGVSLTDLPKKLRDIHLRVKPDDVDITYLLLPLSKMHLYKADGTEGGIETVRMFSIIALVILIIACINYVNLSTARSMLRSKEVSLRKIVGAAKFQLFMQFIVETMVLFLIAAVLAIGLMYLLLPVYNRISCKELLIDFSSYHIWQIIGFTVLGTLIASSIYRAMLLSSFEPIKALKGKVFSRISDVLFRKILVVTQFSLSVILIASTFIISNQLNYIRSKELGYDKSHVLSVNMRSMSEHYDAVKGELMKQPGITDVTRASSNVVSIGGQTGDNYWDGKKEGETMMVRPVSVDKDFIPFFKMKLQSGENFTGAIADSAHFILNETAVKVAGIKDPIGKKFKLWKTTGTIAAVVKDFHFASMKYKIEPVVFYYFPNDMGRIYIKTTAANAATTIAAAEKQWKKYNPEFAFNYAFLDDTFNELYKSEQQTGFLFNAFAVIAILISCLGLFGLAAFTAQRRNREIGVRKVLGASVAGVIQLLAKDFIRLVLVAIIIATPLTWYMMNKWLEDFAYKTTINWLVFLVAGLIAIAIALITVSFQAIKAAVANPVKSLRTE